MWGAGVQVVKMVLAMEFSCCEICVCDWCFKMIMLVLRSRAIYW